MMMMMIMPLKAQTQINLLESRTGDIELTVRAEKWGV